MTTNDIRASLTTLFSELTNGADARDPAASEPHPLT